MTESTMAEILGRVPSGLFIVTACSGEHETGMLASWVQQAGFDPPMITVAVNRSRYVCDWLSADGAFVVNVVGDGDKSLLSHFGRGFEPGQPAFEGLEVERTDLPAPALTGPGVLGHLVCETVGHLDSGDHRVFLGKVTAGRLADAGSPAVHVRKTGLRY